MNEAVAKVEYDRSGSFFVLFSCDIVTERKREVWHDQQSPGGRFHDKKKTGIVARLVHHHIALLRVGFCLNFLRFNGNSLYVDTIHPASEAQTEGLVSPLLSTGIVDHDRWNTQETMETHTEDVHRWISEKVDAVVFRSQSAIHHRQYRANRAREHGKHAICPAIDRHSPLAATATGRNRRSRLADTPLLPILFDDAQLDDPRVGIREDMASTGMVRSLSSRNPIEQTDTIQRLKR